jgi:hypothetical protein
MTNDQSMTQYSFCRKSTMVKHQKRSHRLGFHRASIPDGLIADADIFEPTATSSQSDMASIAMSAPVSTPAPAAQAIASDAYPVSNANNGGGAGHSTIAKPDPYPNDSQTLHSVPEYHEPQMTRQRPDESHHLSYLTQRDDMVATLISSGSTTVPAISRVTPHDGFVGGQTLNEEHPGSFDYEVHKLSGTSEKKLQSADN